MWLCMLTWSPPVGGMPGSQLESLGQVSAAPQSCIKALAMAVESCACPTSLVRLQEQQGCGSSTSHTEVMWYKGTGATRGSLGINELFSAAGSQLGCPQGLAGVRNGVE